MANEQLHRPASQKLPAGLAGVLNPEENRDSAYFSSTDASSKHTSAASGIGINVLSPTSTISGYQSANDKTPSPISGNMMPQPLISPSSNMSINSMVSPTTPGSGRFDRPQSFESNGTPLGMHGGPESRRESVDSRMNQNFGDMRIAGSPYASHNQSTTSIQVSLAQQRNPRGGLDTNLASHRISNGYQPSADRTPDGHPKVSRTAPAITGPATSTIARAAEPTKGQAWAFPEEEIQRMPSAGSFMDSRRSSITESIASSQFTTESRLPPGQRRLDDGMGTDFQRLSGLSADFPPVHHHTLQHKQLSDLHSEESSPNSAAQPYSRTPELRVSHKLAERKRRTEMKELFEQLRDLMPQERGSKASKWEILTKAITEHQRQQEHIKSLSTHCSNAHQESEYLRRELEKLRMENAHLRAGMGNVPAGQAPANAPMPSQQPPSDPYAQDPYGRGATRPELPPLRSLSGSLANGPESMSGVQYEAQRPNGFRTERY
ncbi:putative HLH transcription factor [Pseudomassariella vexata]|uniref:Putative HLH transcription factor n=1 Tax=Pseudomassariella vexata TaxID=1141098 RepID=A0A1Y2DSB9_9PEZI|nr:putative HLH transcription factor [Pseudomassariella vexata]ORY62167.1 putative HLH transcription factor [Pseudomassariella vexata]